MGLQLKINSTINSFRLLVAKYRAVGGTMSDVIVALAMLRTFNDSATDKGIECNIDVESEEECEFRASST